MANTFKSYTKASLGTVTSDVYTTPGGTTTILIGITMSNSLGSGTVYGDVILNKSVGDTVYMIRNVPLYDGASFTLANTGKVILNTGDKIQARSNTNSSVDLVLSVLEQT